MELIDNIKTIIKARKDFIFFCEEILGYKYNEATGYKDFTKTHYELCKFITDKSYNNKLVLTSRYSLKSQICTVAASLFDMVQNPNIRILIYSDTATKAQGFLQDIKNHIEGNAPNSKFRLYFPGWETDAHQGKWNESQIVLSKRNSAFKEPNVDTGSIESSKVGQHYDKIIFDDIVSDVNVTTKAQMDKTYDCYKKSLSLLKPGGEIILVGCLDGDSLVKMSDGTVNKIKDIKVGEFVLSHKDGKIVSRKVEAMIPQGISKTYKLKTRNNEIIATCNHPFLTKDGFKRLDNLKVGDSILCSTEYEYNKKLDYKYTLDDMYILGFWLGDGWVTRHPNSKGSMRWVTCFAYGIYDDLNNKVLNILENKFNFKFKKTRFGYYRTEVARVGRYIEALGYEGKAHTKRIPKYVYTLPLEHKLEFLKGFIAADGYGEDSLRIEICNYNLVKDVKILAESCGYKVSNICSRTRISQPPHSKVPIVATGHHISMGLKPSRKSTIYESKILSIEEVGEREVFDLTVEDTHNFISESFIVHNTRWHFDDTYARIIKQNEDINDFGLFIKSAEEKDEDGKLLYEDIGLDRKFLDYQRIKLGSYLYSALYENNPVSDETALFKIENFNYYEPFPNFQENMFITCTCDPAGEGEDFTAIIVCGIDKDRNIYILEAINDHLKPNKITDMVMALNLKWKFDRFAVETNYFRGTLEADMKLAMKEFEGNPNFKLFSIEPITASSSRRTFAQILGLQPYHERKQIYLPGKDFNSLSKVYSELAYQMIQFTINGSKSPHDDLICALSMHLDILALGGTIKEKEPPVTSAAWMEKQMISEMQRNRSRIPARYRQTYEPVFYR